MSHQTKRDGAGFSLIELLIVVVILGVLATVVVFSVRGVNDRGQEAACVADERVINAAVEAYFALHPGAATIPGPPDSEPVMALVDAGVLRQPSRYWAVNADGSIASVVPC